MIKSAMKKLVHEEGAHSVLMRSIYRKTKHGEVFTPTPLVLEMLQKLPKSVWREDKTFLDPACGNGQFLAAVLIIKRELGHPNPLEKIYGVDIMSDNIDDCRARLLDIAGNTKRNREIVEKNIVCRDGLTYDYSFGDYT